MSARDGAFDAACPVAAHMPGGGFASISLMLAVRILFETVDALVDVLWRVGLAALGSSGCGNGTGVEILALGPEVECGVVMVDGVLPKGQWRLLCRRCSALPACAT